MSSSKRLPTKFSAIAAKYSACPEALLLKKFKQDHPVDLATLSSSCESPSHELKDISPSGGSEGIFSVDLNTSSPSSDSPIVESKIIPKKSKKSIEESKKIKEDLQDKVLAKLKNKAKLLPDWFYPTDFPAELSPEERLNLEASRLAEYLSPTDIEMLVRKSLVNSIERTILELWPNATVQNYGSFHTNTFLPLSDLDIAILLPDIEDDVTPYLKQLLSKITVSHRMSSSQIRSSARVPIINCTERASGLSLDICINVTSGIESSIITRSYLKVFPFLRDLVLLLKYYLDLVNLNKPYRGGLGSYGLTLLIVSFLQTSSLAHAIIESSSNCLGQLLMGFLEHYGLGFFTDDHVISTKDGVVYPRRKAVGYLESPPEDYALVLLDPQDQSVNVARSCFAFHDVQYAFQDASDALKFWLNDYTKTRQNKTLSKSILKQSLGGSTTLHMHRRQLAASYRLPELRDADVFFQ